MSISTKTTNQGTIEIYLPGANHGPVVTFGEHEFHLPEVCRYAARSLIESLTEASRGNIRIQIDGPYHEVKDEYGSCGKHNPEPILSFILSQDSVGLADYWFHKDEFDDVARYLLHGGYHGYSTIHRDVLAAREEVIKVASDDNLWKLLEKEGEDKKGGVRSLSLSLIGLRLHNDSQTADNTARAGLNHLPSELQSYLVQHYFPHLN